MHTHTPITGLQFIGGEWVASSQRTFVSRNPARREEYVGIFPVASAAEAQQAIAAARSAFPGWRDAGADGRVALLLRFGELLRRDADRLATLITRESGRVIADARDEVAACVRFVNRTAAWSPPGGHRPRGVTAVLTPWTFPLGSAVGMLAPALAAGNAAILKPSEDTPAAGQRIAELFAEAGLPPGVLNLLHGDGYVGEALARSPQVDAVLFAGRADVARRLRQLSLEMPGRGLGLSSAGKAALLVCRDADLPAAVEAAAVSAFRSAGQRCDSAGRILVEEPAFDEFIDRFVEAAAALPVGDPL